MKPIDQNYSDNPKTCSGSPNGGHSGQYGKIGFCPCGEYVAHQANKPCSVIENKTITETPQESKTCQCRTDHCPCRRFLAHSVFEPCTAVVEK